MDFLTPLAFLGGLLAIPIILLYMLRLRRRDPDVVRPLRVPLFPLTPLLFCASCLYMLYASLEYARGLAAVGLVPLVVGAPLYLLSRRSGSDRAE